ncbi:MAG: methyltransferase domain-containing protein [Planctomycetes bacterium]|nr:methyltransferase domain-containing protein [Planctomycetota bacterium]
MSHPYRYVPVLSPVYRSVRRNALQYWYAGNQVECELCGRSFKKWLHDANHGTCPYCRSATRHRLLWNWLAGEWKEDTQRSLLHFAPEWCLQRRFRQDPRLSRYVTCDLSAPDVDVHTDITAMSFANETFDAIICSHVLEHIPDDRKAMSEMLRVLRPGGVAIVQVPYIEANEKTDEDPSVTDPQERERRFGQFDHVRLYGRDLMDRLRAAGFAVEEIRPFRKMNEFERKLFGVWDDNIFRCERR